MYCQKGRETLSAQPHSTVDAAVKPSNSTKIISPHRVCVQQNGMWRPFTWSTPVCQSLYKSLSERDSALVTSLRTIMSIIDTAWAWNLCLSIHTDTLYNTGLYTGQRVQQLLLELCGIIVRNSLNSTKKPTAAHSSLTKLIWFCKT